MGCSNRSQAKRRQTLYADTYVHARSRCVSNTYLSVTVDCMPFFHRNIDLPIRVPLQHAYFTACTQDNFFPRASANSKHLHVCDLALCEAKRHDTAYPKDRGELTIYQLQTSGTARGSAIREHRHPLIGMCREAVVDTVRFSKCQL